MSPEQDSSEPIYDSIEYLNHGQIRRLDGLAETATGYIILAQFDDAYDNRVSVYFDPIRTMLLMESTCFDFEAWLSQQDDDLDEDDFLHEEITEITSEYARLFFLAERIRVTPQMNYFIDKAIPSAKIRHPECKPTPPSRIISISYLSGSNESSMISPIVKKTADLGETDRVYLNPSADSILAPANACPLRNRLHELVKILRIKKCPKPALLLNVFLERDEISVEDAMTHVYGENYLQTDDALRKHYANLNRAFVDHQIPCLLEWRSGRIYMTSPVLKSKN